MKVASLFMLSVALFLFSGCAVIDCLDGRHLNHNPSHDRPQYDTGYSGGGHSH